MFLTNKEAWKKTFKDPYIWLFRVFLLFAFSYQYSWQQVVFPVMTMGGVIATGITFCMYSKTWKDLGLKRSLVLTGFILIMIIGQAGWIKLVIKGD